MLKSLAKQAWRQTVRLGEWLSELGDRRRLSWLVYNPLIFMYWHRKAYVDAPVVIRSLERICPDASSYYDVGAGTGAYAACARRRGHEVFASEHSAIARWAIRAQRVPCGALDLRNDASADTRGTFDLAYCFEVAEHVPAPSGDRLVEHLVQAAPFVVFTAAHPGQGGTGHVNEQPKDYWIGRFERRGMLHCPELADELARMWRQAAVESTWLPDNVMVFRAISTVPSNQSKQKRPR